MVKSVKDAFNKMREYIQNRLIAFSRISRNIVCFLIVLAFIKLFSLLIEPDYKDIIDYGEKVTALIGASAALVFTYAATLEGQEKKVIREIGKRFLDSFLYFVIGLILSIGFREILSSPPNLSVFSDNLLRSFLEIYFFLVFIIMLILFLIGFVLLMLSAVHLGIGIYDLAMNDYGSKAKLLNDLQQLGENMTFDEKQIESKDIRKIFETALKINDISFLDKFKDKSNLKYIQKLAELEISKKYSFAGIEFSVYGIGLALFIVGSGNLANAPKYVLNYWEIAGIIIIIIAYFIKPWTRWSKKGRFDFLNDIILQVERKLP
jgi:hypothetical protein